MMIRMDNKPLQEFPQESEERQGETTEQQPNLVTRWMERLAHLGLGEYTLRSGVVKGTYTQIEMNQEELEAAGIEL
jgi:hypothetical protein